MFGPARRIASVRRDGGLVKFALELGDGALVESVLIPMRTRGMVRDRLALCVSTQVGCRMGCVFCATGRMGFRRDLDPGEIAAQPAAAETLGRRPDTLVFMGMGEPLDNLDAVMEAVRILRTSRRQGSRPPLAWSARAMTLSTAGHVEGLERLAPVFPRQMTLAVSLNAPTDAIRSRLMPVNRRWGLQRLREALLDFPIRNRIFLAEYVVFQGINETREHAAVLADWLRPFRPYVNLIAYNAPPGGGPSWLVSPSVRVDERFCRWLIEEGVPARRRLSKGRRISAACGQLATCRIDEAPGMLRGCRP